MNPQIKVLFYGSLREQLGTRELQYDLPENVSTIGELRQHLATSHEGWQQPLTAGRLLSALNQHMVKDDQRVNPGDEVAFFPPVTGG